jgi:hypothetical protein
VSEITNFGVDFEVIEKNQKIKQSYHHQRIMESHIAAYAKEVVRSLAMQYVPTEGFDPAGHQMLRERTPAELDQIIERGIYIAAQTYRLMAEKGWLAQVPPMPELMDDDSEAVGFGQ